MKFAEEFHLAGLLKRLYLAFITSIVVFPYKYLGSSKMTVFSMAQS